MGYVNENDLNVPRFNVLEQILKNHLLNKEGALRPVRMDMYNLR